MVYWFRCNIIIAYMYILLYLSTIIECKFNCSISPYLRDRWYLVNQPRTILRVRRKSVVFKEPGKETLRYKCAEGKGNTFLLRIRDYRPGYHGYLCIGFAYIAYHARAEYSLVRLNDPSIGHSLMGPLLYRGDFGPMSLNDVCLGSSVPVYSYLQRTSPGCKFPKVLRHSWSTSIKIAWRVSFTKSDFTLTLMNGTDVLFRCEKRDKHIFQLRAITITSGQDGILCLRIKSLRNDPFYDFEIARMNSGSTEMGMIMTIPRGKPFHMHEDCDWIDSPARSEFLYTLPKA
ncbi:uncharacterized protein LOC127704298 [Mytilus californianus]|uniref:uncharacterized protein LOC127704298 n=1 Tax=Mytilus californianus TaxID=6549 RepID=UPI0022486CB9|nr:uncharacterized protein LOC127704298 [Mytilus californianus]